MATAESFLRPPRYFGDCARRHVTARRPQHAWRSLACSASRPTAPLVRSSSSPASDSSIQPCRSSGSFRFIRARVRAAACSEPCVGVCAGVRLLASVFCYRIRHLFRVRRHPIVSISSQPRTHDTHTCKTCFTADLLHLRAHKSFSNPPNKHLKSPKVSAARG